MFIEKLHEFGKIKSVNDFDKVTDFLSLILRKCIFAEQYHELGKIKN